MQLRTLTSAQKITLDTVFDIQHSHVNYVVVLLRTIPVVCTIWDITANTSVMPKVGNTNNICAAGLLQFS